jgi:3alpha(or 20beta)-hydroxysteroid dehydrogenase
MGRVDGKVVLITGGGSGLGAAAARLLAVEGACVVLADVKADAAAAVADELGADHARSVSLDVTSEAQWTEALSAAQDAFGPVSALVNSAGVASYSPIDQVTETEFRRVIDINLIGTFLGVKSVVPMMRGIGGGSIVNISSLAGLVGLPQAAAYSASKWGVRGLTKSVAAEVGSDGIRVNSVHPGVIDTPILAAQQGLIDQIIPVLPLGRIGRAQEVAQLIVYLVSDESSYTTGTEFPIDGGWHVS